MSVLSGVIDHNVSEWIKTKIPHLQKGSRFRAYNAIRFLIWADEIFEITPIVSAFCAMHATEEAVAAFIEAAKKHGYKEHAKSINLHDHKSKALVSILIQRVSVAAESAKLSFAWHKERDCLAIRYQSEGNYQYQDLHLSIFEIPELGQSSKQFTASLGEMPTLEDIEAEIEKLVSARNGLIYASSKGSPTGWKNPDTSLIRDAKIALGLIWATIDLSEKSIGNAPIVEHLLSKMASYEIERSTKKDKLA
jgi:hypothetical protein